MHIGDGAIIGAGSVVTHDVAPYEIVAGNPAHTIKQRFTKERIKMLENSQWWELNKKDLISNIEVLKQSI